MVHMHYGKSPGYNSRDLLILSLLCCIFFLFAVSIYGFSGDIKRYTEILEDLKANPESHGGPPDCIVSMHAFYNVLDGTVPS